MKNLFLKKILAAGGLTRHGKLADATHAIQRALLGAMQAGAYSPAPSGAASAVDPARDPVVLDGRFVDSTFTGATGTRCFKLFAPAGFEGEMLPLVVMLHGCTQDPDDFAAGTRMNELAQEHGFFVLYPAQAARSNTQRCWNWFSPADQRRGAGEPALLAGMVRHVLQTHPVDPDRVFVAGLSAGGAMAAILASEYPDVFAAAGVHSGLAAGAAHDVASAFSVMKSGPAPVAPRSGPGAPVIVFHGDADATVVAANGDAVITAALAGAGQVVAEKLAPPEGASSRRLQRTVWRGAGAGPDEPTLAEQWVVQGAPHAWSGGAPAGSYTDPKGPDASGEMLRFFLAHPRRHA